MTALYTDGSMPTDSRSDSPSPIPAATVDAVRTVVADVLNIAVGAIAADAPLVGLGAQSYDFVQVTFRLERAFG
ncbi:MAG: acyl carrier protein, partial [Vicinamibacterales bacterium]